MVIGYGVSPYGELPYGDPTVLAIAAFTMQWDLNAAFQFTPDLDITEWAMQPDLVIEQILATWDD
jgi:hypothetical protein